MCYRTLVVLCMLATFVVDAQAQSPTKASAADKAKAGLKAPPSKKAGTTPREAAEKSSEAATKSVDADEADRDPKDRVPINWRAASVQGPTGLDRVWSADTGPEGTVRMRFSLGWFSASDFPVENSENLYLGTDFSFAYTPHELVEAFLNVRGTSNTNDTGRPELLQTQGDLTFGAKVGAEVAAGVSVGGALGIRLLSGLGGGGFAGDATSLDLRLLTTFDLQKSQQIPLRLHLDTSYYLENGEAVTADVPGEPSIVQEYGLQVARYDRLTLGLGVESPINEYIAPFLEYRVTMPILVELARRGEGTNDYSFASVPHSIALGLRSFPMDELALDLGVRIGLSDQPYTGVPATEPWMLMVGLAYTLDPRPKIIRKVIEKKVPVPAKTPAKPAGGVLAGRVIDAKTKQPISGARIAYLDSASLSPQVTNADGRFGGYRFPSGKVRVQATAQGYKPGNGAGIVKKGKTGEAILKLSRDPAQMKGKIVVRFFNEAGRPIAAKISFSGKAVGTMGLSTPKKPFKAELPSGRQMATVTAKGYQSQQRPIMVKGAETSQIRITLMKPGRRTSVAPRSSRISRPAPVASSGPRRAGGKLAVVSVRGIRLNQKVTFAPGAATLDAAGIAVLDEVAAGLQKITRIQRVRIAVHTGAEATRPQALQLSNSRSRAVKKYLVGKGVDSKRLQARGYGNDKPKGPSLTAGGRARNERVEFVILKKR